MMDAVDSVDKELLKVIKNFIGLEDHANRLLSNITKNFEDLQSSISERKFWCFFFFF